MKEGGLHAAHQQIVLLELLRELEDLLDHVVRLQVLRPDGHLRMTVLASVVGLP
jgi:hypothetical protein